MNDIRSLIEKLDQINEASEVDNVIKRIIDKRGLPKNISEVDEDVRYTIKLIRDQLQSRDSDSFFQSISRGAQRLFTSQDYIQRQYLGTVAEQLKLPGLFTIDGKGYVYTEKEQGGSYKSARYSSLDDAVKLYKAGWVTRDKALELRKDNLNKAFKDEKSIANELFRSQPGPAADWVKANPLPDGGVPDDNKTNTPSEPSKPAVATDPNKPAVATDSNKPAMPGVVSAPGGKDSVPAQAASSVALKKLSSEELQTIDNQKAEQMAGQLVSELEKILKILKDSKLNFMSAIARSLVEADKLYERDLSDTEAETLKTIIFNLEMLGPKLSAETNAKVTNYRQQIPGKYVSQTAPVASPDIKPTKDAGDNADPKVLKVTPPAQKITWKDLVKLNPNIKNPNLVYPGQEIKLPGGGAAVIQKGDSLSKIAQMWNSGMYADGEEEQGDDQSSASDAGSTAPTDSSPAKPAPKTSQPVPDRTAPGKKADDQIAAAPSTGQYDPAVPAKTIYDAVNGMGTDEAKVQAGLKQIANITQWQQADQAAKKAYGSDLLGLIKDDMSNENDLITYVYPELRRIKVPHTVEVRRLDQLTLREPFDKSIAPFYDAQGNFPPKGPVIKDDPNWKDPTKKLGGATSVPSASAVPAAAPATTTPKINTALVPPGSR